MSQPLLRLKRSYFAINMDFYYKRVVEFSHYALFSEINETCYYKPNSNVILNFKK